MVESVEVKEKKILNYYYEWCKQKMLSSGIGTGQLSPDQEIAVVDEFLFNLMMPSLINNYDYCLKIMENRDKILDVLKSRIEMDKKVFSTVEGVVKNYVKES